jgi:hypothetical protein
MHSCSKHWYSDKYLTDDEPNYVPPFTYKNMNIKTKKGNPYEPTIEPEIPGIVEGFQSPIALLIKIIIVCLLLWLLYLLFMNFTYKEIDVHIPEATMASQPGLSTEFRAIKS